MKGQDEVVAEKIDLGCVVLLGVNARTAELHAQQSSAAVLAAVSQSSDLIPAVYEGGLTTWECSYDLAQFLASIDLQGKRVLEVRAEVA